MNIKFKWFFLLISIMVFGLSGCQNVSKTDATLKPKTLMPSNIPSYGVNKKLTEYLLANHINGSVAILRNHKILYNEGFGYSNLQTRTKNLPSTTYPIGSITKTIVATCIMQLQEKGLLNIHDPVAKYIPHFPDGKKMELINLLNHTSGIQSPFWHGKPDKTPVQLVTQIEKLPVTFPPGTKWNYKDEDYMVLGYILEKIIHIPLHQYIQKNIFDRAHMIHSGFLTRTNPVPYALGYLKKGNNIFPVGHIYVSTAYGNGDIYATAYDLALFDQSLLSGKLVSLQSLKEMEIEGSQSDYGLGLYYSNKIGYTRGVYAGWLAFQAFYPDKTSIAVLLNVRDPSMDIKQLTFNIYNIINNS